MVAKMVWDRLGQESVATNLRLQYHGARVLVHAANFRDVSNLHLSMQLGNHHPEHEWEN